MAIAVYAAICGELGVPFSFPGKRGAWTALYEVTDARILAQAAHWAATTPSAAGEAFNITNGDDFRWCNMWPKFADMFGLPNAEPRHISKRVTGPPASLSSVSPVCNAGAADSTCRIGSGFFGASGSAPTSSSSIVAVMAPTIMSCLADCNICAHPVLDRELGLGEWAPI
jgi:hypothetical protein